MHGDPLALTSPRKGIAMTSIPTSLLDRAGLDRERLAKIIWRGLDGADDGELFLEYRQAEALIFDSKSTGGKRS